MGDDVGKLFRSHTDVLDYRQKENVILWELWRHFFFPPVGVI